jgi:aminopeptidase N
MLGPDSAVAFLKFSRAGYIPLQSARGYFEVVRRGADSVAIADLRNLDGIAKRILVNSKGVWVLHMLRNLVGDERFFTTLAAYLQNHVEEQATLPTFRSAFVRAAPEVDVAGFFAQWLDRTGAPRFEVSWRVVGEEVEVIIDQVQDSAPFSLSVELRVEEADARTITHKVDIDSKRTVLRLPAPRGVKGVSLDPDFKVLRWDEAYSMNSDGG